MHETHQLFYHKFSLTKELNTLVKYAWIMKSQEAQSQPDLLIPDGYPEIIFVQKGAYYKEFVHGRKAPRIIDQSCFVGIQSHTVLASRRDDCYLIGVKLLPVGAYALFGEKMSQMANRNVPLTDVGLQWLCDLDQRLRDTQEETSIIQQLNEMLSTQMAKLSTGKNYELAQSFLTAILSSRGQISSQALAEKHCLSVRHFQRKFKGFFGISPKKFLNIIRFKDLYKASILQDRVPVDFLNYGYYDQMHFIKEFKKHLGVNPAKSTEPSFRKMNQMAQRNI